jgi:hypothetical protein
MHQWNELTVPIPRWGNRTGRTLTQPNGDNARESFTLTLIGTDPQEVSYGWMDVNMLAGHEQAVREFIRAYRTMPAGPFQPALGTDLTTNLAIADLREGGAYYLRVANPGCWTIKGSVAVTGADEVRDLVADRVVQGSRRANEVAIPVELKPYGVAAFRVTGPQARVVSWANEPISAKDRAHLEGILALAERLLGDPKALKAVTEEDVKFLKESLTAARAELDAGRVAKAWGTLTYWRFWNLVKIIMEPAAG